ncbi:MAG: DUF6655 family protein [Pirellulaceae bacterium]
MRPVRLNSLCYLALAVAAVGVSGCRSTVRITDTTHTGSQQLLLNSSVDAVIRAIDFCPLAGRSAYLDTEGLGGKSDEYLAYRIREQMAISGVRLAETRDAAEIVVQAGLAAYGTDSNLNTIGVTQTTQLPEFNLGVHHTQYGVAKLSMFAVERESGTLVWQSGPIRAGSSQRIREFLDWALFTQGASSIQLIERDVVTLSRR